MVIDSHEITKQTVADYDFGGSLVPDISVVHVIPQSTRNFKFIAEVCLRNVTVVRWLHYFSPSFSSTSDYFCRYSDSRKSVLSFYFFILLHFRKRIRTKDEGLRPPE